MAHAMFANGLMTHAIVITPIHTGLGKNAVKGGPKKVKVSYQITKRDNEFPPTLQPELTSHDKVHKGTTK